jgi:hypothetical protein
MRRLVTHVFGGLEIDAGARAAVLRSVLGGSAVLLVQVMPPNTSWIPIGAKKTGKGSPTRI